MLMINSSNTIETRDCFANKFSYIERGVSLKLYIFICSVPVSFKDHEQTERTEILAMV